MIETDTPDRPMDHGQSDAVSSVPLWFGPETQRLFGWVHRHAGAVSAPAVVLCPPVGRELTNAHYAYRRLAMALAASGVIVVRFNYDSTGDSVGEEGSPDRGEAWVRSIEMAADLARDHGASSVSLVGLRMGALLAEIAAERIGDIASLVLWDPCASGRSFVRRQRALELIGVHASSDSTESSASSGGLLDAATLAELATIKAPAHKQRPPAQTLVLHRPDDAALGPLVERLTEAGSGLAERCVETVSVAGQPELLDVEALNSVVPDDTIALMTLWLKDAVSIGERAARSEGHRFPATVDTAVIQPESPCGEITERFLNLGELGLFGIETAAERSDPSLPTIIFMNTGKDWHANSNRMWVRLAREWARLGFRCVRFDLSGLGDSPVRPGQRPEVVRAPEAFDDVAEVIEALSSDDPSNVVFVGLCSGAYQSLESGLRLRPRGILAVNPLLAFSPPEMADGPIDPRRRIALPTTTTTMRAYRRFVSPALRRLILPIAWRARRLFTSRRLQSRWLRDLLDDGVDVFCVCGEQEVHQLPELSVGTLAGTPQSGSLRVEVIDDLDHALIPATHQQQVTDLFTAHLVERYMARGDA